jgi:hypothetical protein
MGFAEVARNRAPGLGFEHGEVHREEEEKGNSPRGLNTRPRRRGGRSRRAAVGGALAPAKLWVARAGEERGGSGAGGIRDGARLLYRAEGQAEGRRGGGQWAHQRPPLRPDGGLGAQPFLGAEEAGTVLE